jgi:hypothetical protein
MAEFYANSHVVTFSLQHDWKFDILKNESIQSATTVRGNRILPLRLIKRNSAIFALLGYYAA